MDAKPLLYARCVAGGECLRCPVKGRAVAYGPFISRRRGISIGINLFPGAKVCSYNCVYCFRGPTQLQAIEPVENDFGVSKSVLFRALEQAYEAVAEGTGRVDAVDFSGNGEPTLHPMFPELVSLASSFARDRGVELGIFTNSSTLSRGGIAEAVGRVGYVEAKLDTVDPQKFRAINMPHRALNISSIVEGLKAFRKLFSGVLAIQIMLVGYQGVVNYGEEDASAVAEELRVIEPDMVHIYTLYRVPRLNGVTRAPTNYMEGFAKVLKGYGFRVEVYPS